MALTQRDGSGRFVRGVESAERDAEACRLLNRGWTYQEISDELGYGSKQNAHKAVQRCLRELPMLAAEDLRKSQLQQIASLKRVLIDVMETDHYVVSQGGKIVEKDDKPLIDDGPKMTAVGHYRQVLEREAKLTGTDAPVQRVLTLDDLYAERARLLEEDDDEDDDLEDEAEDPDELEDDPA